MEYETASSSSNLGHEFIETKTGSPRLIPINCAIRIFSFLNRNELDRARLVCRTWDSLISGIGKRHLQKRQVNAVEISSNYEFTAKLYSGKNIKTLTFKKYFCHCDLNSVESHSFYKIIGKPKYNYPCTHDFIGDRKLHRQFKFTSRMRLREKYCSQKSLQIYNLNISSFYRSKIFTPPLDFYIRLKWMLENSSVKYLVFIDFAFTELFVEKFEEYFGSQYEVQKLFIHNCSLKHISCETFHRFVGHIVKAKEYYLESLTNALPNHINDTLLLTPNLLNVDIFLVSRTFGRRPRAFARHHQFDPFQEPVNGGILYFNISQKGFRDFIEARKGLHKEKLGTVFGIQNTLMNEQQVVEEYKQDYKNDGGSNYFKFFILNQSSFCAPDSDFIDNPMMANAQNNAENAANSDNDEEEGNVEETVEQRLGHRKQRVQMVARSVFENNNLKDHMSFDMFKPRHNPAIF